MAQNAPKRNYRVRYDRIIFTVIMLVVFVLLLSSCISSCGKNLAERDDSPSMTLDDALQTTPAGSGISVPTPSQSSPSAYETITLDSDKIHTGDLILANQAHPVTFDRAAVEAGTSPDVNFVTIKSVLDTKTDSPKHYSASDWVVGVDRATAYAMDAWLEGFYNVSGIRYLRMIKGYDPDSDDPDFHTGRGLMIGIYPETGSSNFYTPDGEYAWLADHAAEYGFVQRYPEEKDEYFDDNVTSRRSAAFRYVGVAAATYMKENGLCLEEYLEEIKSCSIDKMLEVSSGAAEYGVYYVPASTTGTSTSFDVPSEQSYTISGNNMDGFIITVALNEAAEMPAQVTPDYEDLDDEEPKFEDLDE